MIWYSIVWEHWLLRCLDICTWFDERNEEYIKNSLNCLKNLIIGLNIQKRNFWGSKKTILHCKIVFLFKMLREFLSSPSFFSFSRKIVFRWSFFFLKWFFWCWLCSSSYFYSKWMIWLYFNSFSNKFLNIF